MSISKKAKKVFVASAMLAGMSLFAQLPSEIPEGYMRVEYIQSSGGAYIDTSVNTSKEIQAEMDFMPLDCTRIINVGHMAHTDEDDWRIFFHPWRGPVFDCGNSRITKDTKADLNVCYKAKFGCSNDVVHLEVAKASNPQSPIVKESKKLYGSVYSSPIRLFGGIDAKGFSMVNESNFKGARMRLYSCKIFKSGSLIRDFVPCVRVEDGEIGLYDVAKNGTDEKQRFYRNKGKGEFVAPHRNVLMLVNKSFEYNGFKLGIGQAYAQRDFGANICLNELGAESKKPMDGPIARYKLPMLDVDVYCTEYLFKDGENSSLSKRKYEILTNLIGNVKPEYVVSVSTSESTTNAQKQITRDASGTANGCVYVGNRFFVADCSEYDGIADADKLKLSTNYYNCAILHPELYDTLNLSNRWVRDGMRPVRYNSAHQNDLRCIAVETNLCVGVVNVTNYLSYAKADPYAYEMCLSITNISNGAFIEGIETTHGVVAKAVYDTLGANIPVMFISPITDRYEHFDADVDGTKGAQNREVSFNGGVVTAHILTLWDKLLKRDSEKTKSRNER